METIQRLIVSLEGARNFTEGLLADFKTPEQWTHQLFPGANHPLWIVGHLSYVDNSYLRRVGSPSAVRKPAYSDLFAKGVKVSGNPGDYPPPEEVLEFARDRRKFLLEDIAGRSEADLAQPLPEGFPPFLPDYGQLYAFLAWHEGMHAGQITVIRRSLGHAPMVG